VKGNAMRRYARRVRAWGGVPRDAYARARTSTARHNPAPAFFAGCLSICHFAITPLAAASHFNAAGFLRCCHHVATPFSLPPGEPVTP